MNTHKLNDRVQHKRYPSDRFGLVVGVFGEYIWVVREGSDTPISYYADAWERRIEKFEAGKTYSIRVGAELGHTFRVFTVEDDIAYGILTYPDGSKTAVDRGQYRYPLIVESVVDDGS